MSNPNYQPTSPRPKSVSKVAPGGKRTGPQGSVNEKSINWPGLPGKSGPNRSAGVKKAKVYAKSEGL